MPGDYTIVATTRTPALIIYLFDISGSMVESFEGSTRIEHLNAAIESTLSRMIQRSIKGEVIAARYRLAMAAYSDSVFDMLNGVETIAQVAPRGFPRLSPTNSTNTYAAFAWARDLLLRELPGQAGKPAPLVCHLTDGHFTSEDPEPIAREIMQMRTADGNVLVENIYLGEKLTSYSIKDAKSWQGLTDASDLQDPYARKLFNMSSALPASYAEMIQVEGYSLHEGSRMLIPGASKELVELAFVMSGATPAM